LQPVFIERWFDNVSERKPFRWFHGGVNAAGYAVGFVAGENTGAGEARGKCFTLPVNKHAPVISARRFEACSLSLLRPNVNVGYLTASDVNLFFKKRPGLS